MTAPGPQYDVVIVGGRPAGSALAARLGARGHSVLVLDRATFPSLPGVPSSPTVHPGTMHLLDELGIAEPSYADPTARQDFFVVEFHTFFSAVMKVPRMHGRDYAYGVDRRQFDLLLWKHLDRFPSVSRREGFPVSGPGWVLVGDALHFKDPVDAQGIYDALIEAKLLDEALTGWLAGTRSWDEAMAAYARRVAEETRAMFLMTVGRLRRELYQEPPVPVIRTLIRWMMTDPEYQERFLKLLGRAIPAEGAITPGLMARATLRGLGRDLRGLLTARPSRPLAPGA